MSLVIASELLVFKASIYYDLQWERAGKVLTVLPPLKLNVIFQPKYIYI